MRAPTVALRVAIVLAAIEGTSCFAIRLSRPILSEEIRTTRDIYREQSELIQRLLAPDSSRLSVVDSLLGWRYRARHRDSTNTLNAQGLRSAREYGLRAAPGVTRVAAFGDSFVYGNEVVDSVAWPAMLERLFPEVEVLNYGVGGYGVDQAYLRFLAEGAALHPQFVIVGFVADDLGRVINVYRRFLSNSELPIIKPRFTLDERGDLKLLPNPAPRRADYERYLRSPRDVLELGPADDLYEPAIYRDPLYDYSATVRLVTNFWLRVRKRYLARDRLFRGGVFSRSSTAFRIQLALFERFAAAVRAAGARPIIVFFPDRESVVRARNGRPTLFAPLVDALAATKAEYIDLTEAFLDRRLPGNVEDYFLRGGDYSRDGNLLVARWLGRAVVERGVRRADDLSNQVPIPAYSDLAPYERRGLVKAGRLEHRDR